MAHVGHQHFLPPRTAFDGAQNARARFVVARSVCSAQPLAPANGVVAAVFLAAKRTAGRARLLVLVQLFVCRQQSLSVLQRQAPPPRFDGRCAHKCVAVLAGYLGFRALPHPVVDRFLV